MVQITKRFGDVIANDHVDFEARKGEIHALLGQNGAGKTTLVSVLYGLVKPDGGKIFVGGQEVSLRSPRDAIELKIGMVHQSFNLISNFSVVENISLGCSKKLLVDVNGPKQRIVRLSEQYGLEVDPDSPVWQLSVGARQRVEIIKALFRDARVIILDEPTSVLSPPEIQSFFRTLRSLSERGNCIIIITHKLAEVMAISDRITVMRNGKVVSTVNTKNTNSEDLGMMMIGRSIIPIKKNPLEEGSVVFEVRNLHALNDKKLDALRNVCFSIHQREILGIIGVDGNGQRELAQLIIGLRKGTGEVVVNGTNMINRSPHDIYEQKLAYVPEEREKTGLIMDFAVRDNAILGRATKFARINDWFLDSDKISRYSKKIISEYDIASPSENFQTKKLSGGNLQKLILARELSESPRILIAVYPTRGLDIGAKEFVQGRILEEREKGAAILLISNELDEVLCLSDKVAVIYEGELSKPIPIEQADIERIGLMMSGYRRLEDGNECTTPEGSV